MSTKKLMEQYTPDEIAASFVITEKLTTKQKKEADLQLKKARKKAQSEMTESDRLALKLMQFKFQIEDYLKDGNFNPKLTFSYFLKEYVSLLNKRRRHFAQEIDINETELSQLINRHRFPSENIIVRLEIHSNNSIPAATWFRLVEREREHALIINKSLRQQERQFVTNKLAVKIG